MSQLTVENNVNYFVGDIVKEKKGKLSVPVYRQSNLTKYYTCPKMFHLAQTLPEEKSSQLIESRATKMGLLFEGYLLGFKEGEDNIKGIGKDVKDRLKNAANNIINDEILINNNPIKLSKIIEESTPYYHQLIIGPEFALTGEADFYHPEYGFFDIKHTEDLEFSGWNSAMRRTERLQSIVYPFMKFYGQKKLMPFYYIIVETKYENPIVKVMHYQPTHYDFAWFREQIYEIHNDSLYNEYVGEYGENCTQQRYGRSKGRCKYLQHCDVGRDILGGVHEIVFEPE